MMFGGIRLRADVNNRPHRPRGSLACTISQPLLLLGARVYGKSSYPRLSLLDFSELPLPLTLQAGRV